MVEESLFKNNLIKTLNSSTQSWVDGDREQNSDKKADIVNHNLKIAIEIKDDRHYKIETPNGSNILTNNNSEDLNKMNERFADHIRSANKKFKEYPNYKTILLFRTEFFIVDVIRYAIEGLHIFKKIEEELTYSGRTGKYSQFVKREIGCFLILENGLSYFPNKEARLNRVLIKSELEKIFGQKIKNVPLI